MRILYNTGIYGYSFLIRIAALWNKKAALWVNGRKEWRTSLEQWRRDHPGKTFWFHCASLGEFEQGRPLLEALKKEQPETRIVLTFFSPSGYEIRKNYKEADLVCYLPADTPANANDFVQLLNPSVVFFIKYEYWANYFFQLKKRTIPLFVVSAILRRDQRFFGWMKSFWKPVLEAVSHFYVQNKETMEILRDEGYSNATLCRDTRFDRVIAIPSSAKEFLEIKNFVEGKFCIVMGSSWPQDEELVKDFIASQKDIPELKVICVPHETDESHLSSIEKKFPSSVRWTQLATKGAAGKNVLIVDTIGMLSSLYQYADVVMIGGGFGKGIHNTLEAAVWGKPILFGPRYEKFEEAKDLIRLNAARSIDDKKELEDELVQLYKDRNLLKQRSEAAAGYVQQQAGAVNRIIRSLREQKITG